MQKKNTKIKEYDHKKIESSIGKIWDKNKIYKTENNSKKKKHYVLDMFPYPSGAGLHVGHPRGYIGSDVYARMKRMQGYNVLHPMGFDAFGLPAEQYAIQTGKHPSVITKESIKKYRSQLDKIGFSYDWDRTVETIDPAYYKWTQWIFLQIYNSFFDTKKQKSFPISDLVKIFEKSGNKNVSASTTGTVEIFTAQDWNSFSKKEKQDILMKYRNVYEGYAEVNWCPELGTVLANDEIIEKNGKTVSERGEYPVEKKSMRQWFMRISAYGDRLINGLDKVDFADSTKETQKNWIGKSIGSEIEFAVKNSAEKITIFTTRADTLFGATYVVLAPEAELTQKMLDLSTNKEEVVSYINKVKNKTDEERQDTKEKSGVVLSGVFAINPANNEEVSVWVADYVIASYGTGAVMAVPAHDERDFEFAKKYNLPIREVLEKPSNFSEDAPYVGYGLIKNSISWADGLLSEDAKQEIIEFVGGKIVTKYKMRDAIFARQRYWGEPIPLIHDKDGIITEVKTKDLPLELPKVNSYKPTGTGESPLAGVKSWVKDGYETNTMPGWAGSSWYFLRYMDPTNSKSLAGDNALKYWRDVDMYVGGTEHNTGHILYARFWHKVMHDLGIVPTDEPFKALRHQGMIGGTDGRKMSKRWGNVINPDDIVGLYGADTLRLYEMFLGPFDSHLPWSTESIIGSRRFVERVWRGAGKILDEKSKTSIDVLYALNDVIQKVTKDISEFKFNTAVSSMMIFMGVLEKEEYQITNDDFVKFLQILAPFAPYVTDEIYTMFGSQKSIHLTDWPKSKKLKERKVMQGIAVQINGKLRGDVMVDPDANQEMVMGVVLSDDRLRSYLEQGELLRTIYVPKKLINFVIKIG
jgi:leucyl-tRNA synthetase